MTIHYWWSDAQGRRNTMEDERILFQCREWVIFAVCDGHGGTTVVKGLARSLHTVLYNELKALCAKVPHEIINTTDLRVALERAIVNLDRHLESKIRGNGRTSGSTIAALAFNKQTRQSVVVSLGDSRCVVCPDRAPLKLFATVDHKPNEPSEQKRIHAAGSFVRDKRVGGVLAMSRAMGDFALKATKRDVYDPVHGPVSATPSVKTGLVSLAGCTVVLACDGVFDVMTNKQAMDFAQSKLPKDYHKTKVNPAKELVSEALRRGTTDNVTAFVIRID